MNLIHIRAIAKEDYTDYRSKSEAEIVLKPKLGKGFDDFSTREEEVKLKPKLSQKLTISQSKKSEWLHNW